MTCERCKIAHEGECLPKVHGDHFRISYAHGINRAGDIERARHQRARVEREMATKLAQGGR